ncbi:MAG TPA: lyase family protein, partial [Elusimicrobiales bacterium]|nr:lyase family protein [Elusimicrobiales bacterium]
MKLWDKGYELDREIESYTVGDDYLLDRRLVPHDCAASLAHARMLRRMGLLTARELAALSRSLKGISRAAAEGAFTVRKEDEDCHTAIENRLVAECGEAGKKIHTARSRNDQVLTALRLYEKESLNEVRKRLGRLAGALSSVRKK